MKKFKNIWLSKDFLKYFLITFIPLMFVMITITQFIKKEKADKNLDIISNKEKSELSFYSKLISSQFEMISSDMFILSESGLLSDFIRKSTKESSAKLEELFLSFSTRKKIYDQIRFLDVNGQERIRVNFNDGKPSIVSQQKLQNKGDRYYFKNTIQLNKGSVFISPFDLNIENGKIEYPLKPMVRFGIPVFDSQNNKLGIIVLNYLGNKLLELFHDLPRDTSTQTMLLNKDGYWLHNTMSKNEWGFMYKDKLDKKIQTMFPKEWNEIYSNNKGQFESDNGLFSYTTIYPLDEIQYLVGQNLDNEVANHYFWKLISFYPKSKLNIHISSSSDEIVQIQIIMSIIFLIASIVLSHGILLRKEADKKEKKAHEDIKKSELQLKKMNADKDKFFSIISHDLRSPFQGIKGIMNLLTNEFENLEEDEVKEAISLLDASINSVYDLLEGLLEWSRTQTGRMEFNPEKINVSDVCNEITQLLQMNANSKKISIINNIDSGVEVFADGNMLKSIIRNLVSNAIKFSRGGGKIIYSAKKEKSFYKIVVSDTGIGMNEEDKEKLFRIDVHHTTAGTQDEAGTGVGLILCKSFVEKNAGEIGVESEAGVGSKFIFTLPTEKLEV